MKKIIIVTLLTAFVMSLALAAASAGMEMEDPVLCVAGKWLVVDAAKESAVTVYLPVDTAYGADGGCRSAASGPVFVKDVVKDSNDVDTLFVSVKAKQAVFPLTVSYGKSVQQAEQNGERLLWFAFGLR